MKFTWDQAKQQLTGINMELTSMRQPLFLVILWRELFLTSIIPLENHV